MKRSSTRILRRTALIAVGGLIVLGAAACASSGGSGGSGSGDSGSGGSGSGGSGATASSAPVPTGATGAANFDAGYLAVGHGGTTVDEYFDPMCPICGEFEHANGSMLAGLVDDGTITMRLHPMTFLDRSSQGTQYSTRADAALTCVAEVTSDKTVAYLAALYHDQPAESSSGRTDKQLVALADGLGVPDITTCMKTGENQAWAQHVNDEALAGPVAGADGGKITGTPTVIVDGHEWKLTQAGLTDSKNLKAYIAKQ